LVLNEIPKGGVCLEIGVLGGDYSTLILDCLSPQELYLLDTFDCQDSEFTYREPRFSPNTHFDFVKSRFNMFDNVHLIKSRSEKIDKIFEPIFDYIYIDADHTYEGVRQDLENSAKLIKPGGIIGLNDYIMWDYLVDFQYGVVQAVNEWLFANPDWKVKFYALSPSMFSDIYLERNS
jgi:hypothetical protein